MVNAKKLKELMDAHEVSARELARYAKVSDAMMSYILAGDKVPSVTVLGKIARRLECTIDEITVY